MSVYNNLSLNRITCPQLNIRDFISRASEWGFAGIELRNDLGSGEILDGSNPVEIAEAAEKEGISIFSINALQRFNDDNPASHIAELENLLTLASALNKTAIVLCPVNDPDDKRTYDECFRHTVEALKLYAPYFQKYKISGLVEPLGFSISSLRTKEMALNAIMEADGKSIYKILHDTFHHYLAGEKIFYPEMTGLVHVSGVEKSTTDNPISDEDRVLIGDKDIMGNREQIQSLLDGGYHGVISIESFSSKIQELSEEVLEGALKKSLNYLFL